jgi:hypothetical protein
MSCFTDSLRQRKLLRMIHVMWTTRIYPGARTTLSAALCALFLVLAGTTFLFVPTAQAAGGQVALSTPLALTSLGLKGTPSVVLDNQGYFHLLYQTDAPSNQVNLEYKVVKSTGQSIQQIEKTITLASAADSIDSTVLVVDSRSRLHAAWIESRNGAFFVRDALVENPASSAGNSVGVPTTLYQSSNSTYDITGGADSSGNVFYGWLDRSTGTPNLETIEIHDDQSAGQPLQLTQQTDQLDFPHLIVYPDDTLVGVMLHQSPQETWDLTIYPFDATGKSLHAPMVVIPSLHPGPANQASKDTNTFHTDPMAVALDAQQHLHIAWGQVLQLGYTDAMMQPDYSFTFQPKTLSSTAYDNQNLCLNAGPAYPVSTSSTTASPLWLGWLDTSQQPTLHPYIAQISDQGTLKNTPTSLVDAGTLAAAPCVQQNTHGSLYVTWTQYNDNGNYVLEMATNTVAAQSPFWVKLGLNRNDPIQQVIFIILGSILLGALGMLPNLLATPVAAVVVRFGTRLHIHRLALLLVGLGVFIAVDIWFQGFMAGNFGESSSPIIWTIVGVALALILIVYLWYRSRRYPPETMGAIGQLLLASYAAAIVISIPLIYIFTQHQS